MHFSLCCYAHQKWQQNQHSILCQRESFVLHYRARCFFIQRELRICNKCFIFLHR